MVLGLQGQVNEGAQLFGQSFRLFDSLNPGENLLTDGADQPNLGIFDQATKLVGMSRGRILAPQGEGPDAGIGKDSHSMRRWAL